MNKLTIPNAVLTVIQTLHDAGHEALLAGGCVRDMLLAIEPYDYDIATSATPDQVVKLFKRSLTVGAQFGVVVVLIDKEQIEVATFRSDVDYTDGRRPNKIVYTTAEADAQRRDFTINGMFYDPIDNEVIDYVDGKKDLEANIIRAIGNADERFAEDHLRMLRALRFAGRFNYEIENDTWLAICKYAEKIEKISYERITAELEKIIAHSNRKKTIAMINDSCLLKHIFANLTDQQLETGLATINCLPNDCSDFALIIALLLIDCETKLTDKICRQMTFSNDIRKKIHWLKDHYQHLLDGIPFTKGHLKLWLAEQHCPDLVNFCNAYLKANDLADDKLKVLAQHVTHLGDEEISPTPFVTGDILIKSGIKPGPAMGKILKDIYLLQLEGEITSYEQAIEKINALQDIQ